MDPNQDRAVQAAFDGHVPAAEHKRVVAENDLLRAALKPFADAARSFAPYPADMNAKIVEASFTLAQLCAAADAMDEQTMPHPHDCRCPACEEYRETLRETLKSEP